MRTKEAEEGQSFQHELLALREIIASMQGTSELGEVLEQISTAIVQVLGYDNSVIALLDRDKATLKPAAINFSLGKGLVARFEGMIGKRLIDFEIPADRDYNKAMRALLDGEVYLTHRLSDLLSPRFKKVTSYAMQQQAKVRTLAIIPLPGSEGVVGSILVTTPRKEITEAELQTLVTFADQAGIIVEKAWLQEEVKRQAAAKEKAEQKVREQAVKLRGSRAFIESMFSTIADPVVVLNSDLVIIAVNKATTELLGYREDELIGHKYIEVYTPPELRPSSGKRAGEVIAKGVTSVYEATWLTKDSERIVVQLHIAPLRNRKGAVIGAIATARDMRQVKSLIAELERSKAFIESVFRTIADPVVVVNPDKIIIAVNEAIIELLGYGEHELIGHNYIDVIIPPARRHLSGKTHSEVMAKGVSLVFERMWQTKNGEEIPVAVHEAPLLSASGEIIGSIAVGRDIRQTKSLIAELERRGEELALSEGRHRDLVENINDSYCVIQGGNIVFANKTAAEMLGYDIEEAIGEPFVKFIAPECLSEVQERYEKRMRGEAVPPQYETLLLKKDGTRLPVDLSVRVALYRDSLADHVLLRDISERKRLEREKAEAWERYRAILEHAPDPIIVTDADNIVQFWNRCAEEHSGYKAEEVVGKSPAVVVPPDLHQEARWLTKEALEKGRIDKYETERVLKDGRRAPVEITIAPLRDASGNLQGFIIISRDISEKKRLEREKAEAQERMIRAEKLASIGQVGSSVAHELRQPLSVINNAVYFLRMQLPDVEGKVKKHLGILEKEVASAEKIISELLDLGRPRKLHLEPAELDPIIEQALSRAQLPQGVKVSTELKELPPITVDAEQLGRVFLNIIINAAQAMPDGGHLDVTSDREDNSVVVRFQDSGCGIAAEDMDMLFEPMFTTKARGVGLGLTICKSIIEALQGTIGIQSELGHGTTVSIKLPITKQGEDNG